MTLGLTWNGLQIVGADDEQYTLPHGRSVNSVIVTTSDGMTHLITEDQQPIEFDILCRVYGLTRYRRIDDVLVEDKSPLHPMWGILKHKDGGEF